MGSQLTPDAVKMKTIFLIQVIWTYTSFAQRVNLDFSNARKDESGALCIKQEVCIPAEGLQALADELPPGPCIADPRGCNCESDEDCGGGSARCVNCKCKDCPVSAATSGQVRNPPLTFVIDTTKSVKPDKDSIFNLTQRVVDTIQATDTNIDSYLLVTFNDFGPDIKKNVQVYPPTTDVLQFKRDALGLVFESFNGGRDSRERLTQGLLTACQVTPVGSLVVVFTDNGTKDLKLEREIMRLKEEKQLEIYIVLTPVYEGRSRDPSLP